MVLQIAPWHVLLRMLSNTTDCILQFGRVRTHDGDLIRGAAGPSLRYHRGPCSVCVLTAHVMQFVLSCTHAALFLSLPRCTSCEFWWLVAFIVQIADHCASIHSTTITCLLFSFVNLC